MVEVRAHRRYGARTPAAARDLGRGGLEGDVSAHCRVDIGARPPISAKYDEIRPAVTVDEPTEDGVDGLRGLQGVGLLREGQVALPLVYEHFTRPLEGRE